MKIVENHCVDCGLPCQGDACRYRNVVIYRCDDCGKIALYQIDGHDFCVDCAEYYLDSIWRELYILDKAELLNVESDII